MRSMIPHSWAADITAYTIHLGAAARPESTIKLRRYQLGRAARELQGAPGDVLPEVLEAWLGNPRWSADTRRSYRSALRAFYAWRVATGRATSDPAAMLPHITAPQGTPRPAPEDVVRAALALLDIRTALMVRLGALAGLRCCEIATTRGDRLERDLMGWSLRVRGKGGRVRLVPVDDRTAHLVAERGRGWTFEGRDAGHLSPAYVSKVISRALPPGVTAHMLRHRYASAAYALGGRDLLAVRDLLGHASVATTQVYTAIPAEAARQAAYAAALGWEHSAAA